MTVSQSPEELLAMSRRLMAEVQALSGRISAVNEIAVAMNRSLDLDEVLAIVGRQAKWMLDFHHCSVYLPHDPQQQVRVLFGAADQVLGFLASIPNQPLQRALDTHQPQLLKDIEHGPFKSVMIMPLQTEDQVHGTLNFAAKRANAYSFDDLRIAYILALLLAAAIRNATQFAEITALYEKLKREQERSERLLLNVLPRHVAAELKLLGSVKPTSFDQATVLFTDFVGFSHTTNVLTPEELVNRLDLYFSEFDQICLRWGLEKLKTIGDSYMCVSGVPVPSQDHAIHAVQAALEMCKVAQQIAHSHAHGWELRVGINSGPLVAGVIGHQKFSYDVWGTTVNLASRLETHSEPGRINISQATFELVRDDVHTTYRGSFPIKNLGTVEMYFVDSMRV